jgi:hypothetical protein
MIFFRNFCNIGNIETIAVYFKLQLEFEVLDFEYTLFFKFDSGFISKGLFLFQFS